MSAKEFLRSVRRMDELIDRKQRQLERLAELRAQAESCTVALSPDKVQTSGRNSAENIMVRIIDLQYEINADIDKYAELRKNAYRMIDSLDDSRYVGLLYRYYLEQKTWEEVAVEMKYSYRRIMQLHGYALNALNQKIAHNCI